MVQPSSALKKKWVLFSGALLLQLPLISPAWSQTGFYISRVVDTPSVEIDYSALEQLGQTDAKKLNDALGPKEFLQPSFNPQRTVQSPVSLTPPTATAPKSLKQAPRSAPKSGLVVNQSKPKAKVTAKAVPPKAAPAKAPKSGLVEAKVVEKAKATKPTPKVTKPKTLETVAATAPKIETPKPKPVPVPKPVAKKVESANQDAKKEIAEAKAKTVQAVSIPKAEKIESASAKTVAKTVAPAAPKPVVKTNEPAETKIPVPAPAKKQDAKDDKIIETAALTPTESKPKTTAPKPVQPSINSNLGDDPVVIAFPNGESSLPLDASKSLDDIATYMKSNEQVRIQIRGYASLGDGNVSESRKLSLYRSMEIRTYLQSKGIKPIRMDVRALGDTDKSGADLDRVDIVFP